jgi:hypothetical protein
MGRNEGPPGESRALFVMRSKSAVVGISFGRGWGPLARRPRPHPRVGLGCVLCCSVFPSNRHLV